MGRCDLVRMLEFCRRFCRRDWSCLSIWWCLNCSAGGCFVVSMRGRRCGIIWGWRGLGVAIAFSGVSSLPHALDVLFRALRATYFSSRGKVGKTLAPTLGFHCVKTPLVPSLLRGHATTGRPWPIVPLAASLPLNPLHNDSTRPALKGRADQDQKQDQLPLSPARPA